MQSEGKLKVMGLLRLFLEREGSSRDARRGFGARGRGEPRGRDYRGGSGGRRSRGRGGARGRFQLEVIKAITTSF